MPYTVILKDRDTGIVLDMMFPNKEDFDNWYDQSIQSTDEILAEGIDREKISLYTRSPEARKQARSQFTPDISLNPK